MIKCGMSWLFARINQRKNTSEFNGEKLGYLDGSYSLIVDELEKLLIKNNVKFILSNEVELVSKDKSKYIINNDRESNFDIIISTLDYRTNEKLLKSYMTKEEYEKSLRVEYISALTTVLETKKSISPYYWLNVGNENIPFCGIIEHTNLVDKKEYNNHSIIYISNYLLNNDKMYLMNDEDIIKEYIKSLKKINPNFSDNDIIDYKITREPRAQPIIGKNYSKDILNFKLKDENIYLCSMAQIYPEDRGVNCALKLAQKFKCLEEKHLRLF